jgi:hypothetical protein
MDETPNYYVMVANHLEGGTMLRKIPMLPGGPWMAGKRLAIRVPEPLQFGLNPNYPGRLLAMYKGSIPLIRDDLLEILRGAGVDNLETFKAVLNDPIEKKDHHNYKAFNIVGVVSCADPVKSINANVNDHTIVDVNYQNLVIDEKKAGGLLFFRLAESVNAIVVHRKIKEAIEPRNIAGMHFFGPGEWAS